MTDELMSEVLQQGFLGLLLVAVTIYFLRELKLARSELADERANLRELEKSLRETVVPAMVSMTAATQAATTTVAETRAELRDWNRRER